MARICQLTPELLRKAAEALQSHKWLREYYFSFEGEAKSSNLEYASRVIGGEEPCGMCAAGALIYAASREGEVFSEKQKKNLDFQDLLFPAKIVCEELTSEIEIGRNPESRHIQLILFNDILANNKEEVVSLLEKMADYMEQNSEKIREILKKLPGGYMLPKEI